MTDTPALLAEDLVARERALDPAHSFLVQAPAGSGKTGLLIQRFLALLAHVDRPERIVAMTFTRKAAGEMCARIVEALQNARDDVAVRGDHERRTRKLALAALEHGERSGWHLLDHPARLRIGTIDAFTTGLARAAPLATGLGGTSRLVDDATTLYAQAVRDALRDAAPDEADWQRLLAHLDNDADRAVDVLVQLLGKRDQWLSRVVQSDAATLRAELEAGLAAESAGELAAIAALFPCELARKLAKLEARAAANLEARPDDAAQELAGHLRACANNAGVPPAEIAALDAWRALAGWLLLPSKPSWRKSFNADSGFPPKGGGKGAAERAAAKVDVGALAGQLQSVHGLAEALDAVRTLPPPRYGDAAWEVVAAVLAVLPRVVAQFRVALARASAADFTEATLAALRALGSGDAPSDLLLRLDLAIGHLLIDEFQDTSQLQLELVQRLVAGWQPGDGRTLFVVGDPMQSVYRFRNAEVRIFIEAQQRAEVAGVPVECLMLRRNFRTQAALVDWTNRVFPAVLGSASDPWRSVVAFAEAVPHDPALPGEPAPLDIVGDDVTEAACVVTHVREALANGGDVAILVRARSALSAILPALREAGIAHAAVDVDTLGQRQAILDLTALTHALAQPADRLAWLAVARAPWCSLTLPDLFALADAVDRSSFGAVVHDPGVVVLTPEGHARFTRLAAIMAGALAARGRASLAARVRGAWIVLDGPATLAEALDVESAERFFALIEEHERGGDIPDWPAFVAALDELRAPPAPDASVRVTVMTLHKAKGLEFDTVVIPGLATPVRAEQNVLLRWRQRPAHWLLAPAQPKGSERDPVYAYLKRLDRTEEDAELGRLLYVGCTRAKRRLHLLATLDRDWRDPATPRWKPPERRSPLALLWPVLAATTRPPAGTPAPDLEPERKRGTLDRLPEGWSAPPVAPSLDSRTPPASAPVEELPFDWVREAARHVGTLVHRVFLQIAHDGLVAWNSARADAQRARFRVELRELGVGAAEIDAAIEQAVVCVKGLIAHPRGRFAFDPARGEAQSEWALAGLDEGAVAHVSIDRTFVADGERWIVDFKTGAHEGGDVEAFLDREVERYRPQLERYARIVRGLDRRPIRVALFYPRIGGWREWRHDG